MPEQWRLAVHGTAAIEFAIFTPVLLILLVGAVELGFSVFQGMQVQNAAEAGALYVAKHGWNSAGISGAVVNATGVAGVTATPAPSQFCGCAAASGITKLGCSSTCPDGTSAGNYVQIDAALAHTPILVSPSLLVPATLTGRAIVRLN